MNYRILKLKVELLGVLAILPQASLRWESSDIKDKETISPPQSEFQVGQIVETPYGLARILEIRQYDDMIVLSPTKWVLANAKPPTFYMKASPPAYTPAVRALPNANSEDLAKKQTALFVRKVQDCVGNQELLDLIIELGNNYFNISIFEKHFNRPFIFLFCKENALPSISFVDYNKNALPSGEIFFFLIKI